MKPIYKVGDVLTTAAGSTIRIVGVYPNKKWDSGDKKSGVGVYEVDQSRGFFQYLSFEYIHTSKHIIPTNKYQKILYGPTGHKDE